tara:strand:- start:45 stop:308 length:264 start_codon:yes stop_codon:yes gene_type:complete
MIKPLKDRVLIKPKKIEEKTEGGIYVPDSAREDKLQEGEVVAVGDSSEIALKQGDKVLFEDVGCTELRVNGERHVIMNVKDILAKVE